MLPGPQTQFSTADNPVAKAASLLTRLLTFSYLPVFNFQLLLYPAALSFDWGMDAIPMLRSPADVRNLLTVLFYGGLAYVTHRTVRQLILSKKLQPHRTPAPATLKRLSRLQRQQQQQQQPQHPQRKPHAVHHTVAVIGSALVDFGAEHSHCVCSICKQGLDLRHTSRCRALNNNNAPAPSGPPCGCPPFRHPSPTPSASSSSSASSTSSRQSTKSNKSTASSGSSSSTLSAASRDSRERRDATATARTRTAHRCPPERAAVLLCLALMALSFLPASNMFVYVGFVVAERILYLPSVGFCLLVGLGFGKLVDGRRGVLRNRRRVRCAVLAGAVLLLAAGAAKTMQRNLDWRDEESLYRSAISINPPKGERAQRADVCSCMAVRLNIVCHCVPVSSARQSGQCAEFARSVRRCEGRPAAGPAVPAQHGRRALQSVSEYPPIIQRRKAFSLPCEVHNMCVYWTIS